MTKAKGKPSSSVPGAYLREDGKPRWGVKIRWTDAQGRKQHMPPVHFPIDTLARPGTPFHINQALRDVEA